MYAAFRTYLRAVSHHAYIYPPRGLLEMVLQVVPRSFPDAPLSDPSVSSIPVFLRISPLILFVTPQLFRFRHPPSCIVQSSHQSLGLSLLQKTRVRQGKPIT